MLFDGRALRDIQNSEVAAIVVSKAEEDQHLEFKATVELDTDEKRIEFLRDIVALANGGGGYFVVGISEDGTGRASGYSPQIQGKSDQLKKSMKSLAQDNIRERIDGLEVEARNVDGNEVVVLRVPPSARTPHMVSFKNKTEFYCRYGDGKREMTITEIRNAFQQDSLGRQIADIYTILGKMSTETTRENAKSLALTAVENGSLSELLTVEDAKAVSEALRARGVERAQGQPFFQISLVPVDPKLNFVDLEAANIRSLLQTPPDSRYAGWNMNFNPFQLESKIFGLQVGKDQYRLAEYWRNGCMTLSVWVVPEFFWGQSQEEYNQQPLINQLVLIEFLVSSIRLFHLLMWEGCGFRGDYLASVQYLQFHGLRMKGRTWLHEPSEPFSDQHCVLNNVPFSLTGAADEHAHLLLTSVYAGFGMTESDIPFWNLDEKKFVFPES